MTGAELKNIIKGLPLKQKEIALAVGVSDQAFASYFRTTDVRKETIDKIDTAIYQLTNGQYRLVEQKQKETTPLPEQNENIIETLAGVVKDVERELADIRIMRSELIQARDEFRTATQELRAIISQLTTATTVDLHMAADENPRPK